MACVLQITAAGVTWWGRRDKQWVTLPEPGNNKVWVITDLAEESLAELAMPRIFGADRSRFAARQLANRFPDTEFRTALVPQASGSLMNRLLPAQQTLVAVESAERIKPVLADLKLPVAGVWCTSVLLSQLALKQSPATNMLVVFSQPSGMRIVFLKNRTPVLTRLVAPAATAQAQSVEVLRTMRHLENTRVIERAKRRISVLLLGVDDGLAAILTAEQLEPLQPQAWREQTAGAVGCAQLFDWVVKSPPGQLAPLQYRNAFVAGQVVTAARVASVVCLVSALVAASDSLQTLVTNQRERVQLQATLTQTAAQIAELDTALAGFGFSPDLLRTALSVDQNEIANAAGLETHLLALSRSVSQVDGARVKSLQWQVLEAAEPPCTRLASALAGPIDPAVAQEPVVPALRQVEIQLSIALPPQSGPTLRLQQATALAASIRAIANLTVMRDPVASLRSAELGVGDTRSTANADLAWCVVLPGVKPNADALQVRQP